MILLAIIGAGAWALIGAFVFHRPIVAIVGAVLVGLGIAAMKIGDWNRQRAGSKRRRRH